MKKTLLLTHEYYPFKGGVANYCFNLFKFFSKEEYLLATDCKEVIKSDNIIKVKLRDSFIWPSWIIALWRIKEIIKQHKIEIIFTPNILPLGTIAMFSGLPYIISLHGMDINLALKNKTSLTKKILNKAKYILVNSYNTKSALGHLNLDENKIKLFYPSVEVEDAYEEYKLEGIKNKYKIKENDKILLTVGRLNKRKAQDLVIKAVARLPENIKYFIVGNGSFEKDLKKTIKHYKLGDRVFIINQVSNEDLVYYYKLANIFVLPQRKTNTDVEGFGMVFLEASYYGLPIIAGKSGGVTEILDHKKNAILLEKSNLDALLEALEFLLNNKAEADKIGQQAQENFAKFARPKEQSEKLRRLLEI